MPVICKGTELDRYVAESILGEGGMATVYRVRHRDLGTPYAIKLLKLRIRSLADRLLQEGRIQASLRHPNIVAVTDVLRFDDDIGLVMEYVDGVPLDLLLVNHRLDTEEIDALASDMFDGIEAAHQLGLVHRDLKPANVMVAIGKESLTAKITDFGLAKAVSEELTVGRATRTGAVMGTPTFMAPEQLKDASKVDARADIFALGLILYELICGVPAIAEASAGEILEQVMKRDYDPIREYDPNAPKRWLDAFEACVQPDREDRPASIAELRALWNGPTRAVQWSSETMAAARHIQACAPPPPQLPSHAPDDGQSVLRHPRTTREPEPGPQAPTPPPSDEEKAPPSRAGRLALATILLSLGGAAAVVVGAVGLIALLSRLAGSPEASTAPVPAPAPVEVADADIAPPVPRPEPPRPEPEPEPEALPEPEPEPAPRVVVTPPEPEVVQVPDRAPPAPVPEPQPVPAPVAPAPVPVTTGRVAITNGDYPLFLKPSDRSDGDIVAANAAPPGTYDLWVDFGEGAGHQKAGQIDVQLGQLTRVKCEAATYVCIAR